MDVTEVVRAAGGVVRRRGPDGELEVVLVHRPKYDDWSLPKGKLHAGETELAGALREVEEETGLRCRPIRDLGLSRYHDSAGRPKTVRYWEMQAGEREELVPAHEIDEARWTPLPEASALLTYDRDRELLERFERLVSAELTEARAE